MAETDPPRVVSLIPSATEIVAALGYAHALVGRSHECDEPPGVEQLPTCTESRLDASQSSRSIHEQLTSAGREQAGMGQALSIYQVDTAQIDALAPDLIITQSLCDVCAVSLEAVEQAVGKLVRSQPRLVACEPNTLEDVWADVHRIAAALDDPQAGRALVGRVMDQVRRFGEAVQQVEGRPRVACLEWLDPLMGAGNWVPHLVELAGGECVFGQAGEHAAWLDWDRLASAAPEVIVLMPCGFTLQRTVQEATVLQQHEAWAGLPAVQAGQVYAVDGHHYFNRPGPRLVESLAILAQVLHPRRFGAIHEGVAWQRCTPEVRRS